MPARRVPRWGWIALLCAVASAVSAAVRADVAAPGGPQTPAPPPPSAPVVGPHAFPAQPHPDVPIEWWYVNAHVTTASKRHLALVAAFFRFTGPSLPFQAAPPPACHYLIYALTDLDAKTHRYVSIADQASLDTLEKAAPVIAALRPNDPEIKRLADALAAGKFPEPHLLMDAAPAVDDDPLRLTYGSNDTLAAVGEGDMAYDLALGDGPDKIKLHLDAVRRPMSVGGKGETGLHVPTDMFYFSLTRMSVTGAIDTGNGPDAVASGKGWLDHQWGSSWSTDKVGWDWFGIQLDDGTDILVFRQRDLATGKVFFPLATFMDASGKQWVTRKIGFTPDPRSQWKSPATGVSYPLAWTLSFPEQRLQLRVTSLVPDQEIPILPPGTPIWEGSCVVTGSRTTLWRSLASADRAQLVRSLGKKGADADAYEKKAYKANMPVARWVSGQAYMELVGYNAGGGGKSAAGSQDPVRRAGAPSPR